MVKQFNVNEYLKDALVEDYLVRLPPAQLDRKEYLEVKRS